MTEPEDLGDRVSALEAEVHDLSHRVRAAEQDAAAVRVLADGADRDVSEYRTEFRAFKQAATASFNATRADLADLRGEVHESRSEMNARFEQVDRNFLAVRGVLDAHSAGLRQIANMLTVLIERDGGESTSNRPAGEPG